MKAAVLLALGILLLAAAPLAAASPTAPRTAAQDPTRLQALLPPTLTVGQNTVVEALLEDALTGAPIAQANISFARKTNFGALALGTTPTNAEGEAYLAYAAPEPGNFTVVVAFGGNDSYAPSNASAAFTVLPAGAPPPAGGFPTTTAIVLVILAVVGGVWATYAFVAFLILGIRADRPEAEETTSELKEKESMADDEEKPQRVPGSVSATSRTVAIVAAVALVLGGLAVTLAVVSTLGGTKAASYTPSAVSLDVSVVPDIRGDGWDSFLPDILIVHQGDTVTLHIFNADTMDHGFAIDAFGVRVTVTAASNATGAIVPSETNVTFVASEAGSFRYYCTVYCGDGHDTMEGTLTVLPDD